MSKPENRFYVYVMFRPWNGIPCYVGKGSGRRATKPSRKLNPHLENIIKKAGGSLPTVIIRSELNEKEAFDIEKAFIKAIGRKKNGGPLSNLTDGGDGTAGWVPTAEFRAKVSLRTKGNTYNLGRKQSKEEIEKRRKSNTGKRRSEKTKLLMSIAQMGNKKALGRKVSPETRALISKANSGRKFTSAHRKKLSEKAKGNRKRLGKYHSLETKLKISQSRRNTWLQSQNGIFNN